MQNIIRILFWVTFVPTFFIIKNIKKMKKSFYIYALFFIYSRMGNCYLSLSGRNKWKRKWNNRYDWYHVHSAVDPSQQLIAGSPAGCLDWRYIRGRDWSSGKVVRHAYNQTYETCTQPTRSVYNTQQSNTNITSTYMYYRIRYDTRYLRVLKSWLKTSLI